MRAPSTLLFGLSALLLAGCDVVLGLGGYKYGCPDGTVVDSADAACPGGMGGSGSPTSSSVSGTSASGTSSSSSGAGGAGGAPPNCEAMGLTTCGGACVDLMKDGDHCNACDHSCGGGECLDGICQPVTLASGIAELHSIGIDGARLYFTAGNLVRSCLQGGPCTGAGLKTLADFTGQNDDGTGSLAVTEGLIVFFGNTNGSTHVHACPTDGCATLSGLGFSNTGYAKGIAMAVAGSSTVAYVHNPGGFGLQSTTCTGTQCGNLVSRVSKTLSAPPLAATPSHYYYQKKVNGVVSGIVRCPTSEGTCTTVENISSVTNAVTRLVTTPTELFILWAGGAGGGSAIGRCPLTGCPGSPTIVRTSTTTFRT